MDSVLYADWNWWQVILVVVAGFGFGFAIASLYWPVTIWLKERKITRMQRRIKKLQQDEWNLQRKYHKRKKGLTD